MATERNPHLILCNGAKLTSRSQLWREADPLPLTTGLAGNVRIQISEIARQLSANVDNLAADLLEIAAFVYVADQAVKRTGHRRVDYGDEWYRDYRFEIAVREPDFWNDAKIKDSLVDTLDFLSGDGFEFVFAENKAPTPFPSYLDYSSVDPNPAHVSRVVLFSGGLDSLTGAAEEILDHKRRVALVSHKPVGHMATRQNKLVQELRKVAGREATSPVHVSITANKKGQLDRDHTQRSRSFLYVALGAVVAGLHDLREVYFYENGIMSVNLPLADHELGARASRTTHPKTLIGFQNILTQAFQRPMAVRNEYLSLTKQDVVQRLKGLGLARLAESSVSCMHTRETTSNQPHCGKCAQCLCRRLATLGASFGADDPGRVYRVDPLLGARPKTEDRTVAERFIGLAHKIESLSDADQFGREFAFELGRITPYCAESRAQTIENIFDLHHTHAEQVAAVIREEMSQQLDEYYHGRLEPTCALLTAFTGTGRSAPTSISHSGVGQSCSFVPSANEWTVLVALHGANGLMRMAHLVAATDALGQRLSRRTIGPIMSGLKKRRLIEYPRGPRSGAKLTDAGTRFVESRTTPSH